MTAHFWRRWHLSDQEEKSLNSISLPGQSSEQRATVVEVRHLSKVNLADWDVSVLQMHVKLVDDEVAATDMEQKVLLLRRYATTWAIELVKLTLL